MTDLGNVAESANTTNPESVRQVGLSTHGDTRDRRTAVGELLTLLASLELVLWTFSKHVLPLPWRYLPVLLLVAVMGWLLVRQRADWRAFGFAPPSWLAGTPILAGLTAAFALAIALWGAVLGTIGQFDDYWRWVQNAITQEVLQQILLQVLVFPRCAVLLGGAGLGASVLAGTLFALVHLPNLPLVALTWVAGIVWCEWFRRYRNMLAVWASHLLLAAVSLYCLTPILGRLRVGVGYLYVR